MINNINTNNDNNNNYRHHVVGTNDEPCNISGSICAERAALIQLRFIPNIKEITKIVISTDAPYPLYPGMLCREFMSSHDNINPKTMPIVMVGSVCKVCNLDITRGHLDGDVQKCKNNHYHKWDIIRTTLKDIYPYPSPYTRLSAKQSIQLASTKSSNSSNNSLLSYKIIISTTTTKLNSKKISITTTIKQKEELIKQAINIAKTNENIRISLHPIQYVQQYYLLMVLYQHHIN